MENTPHPNSWDQERNIDLLRNFINNHLAHPALQKVEVRIDDQDD